MDMQTRTWLLVITDGWERAKSKAVVSNVNSLTHVVPNQKKSVEEYDHSFQYNESDGGIKLSSSKITKSTINVCRSGLYDSYSIISKAIQQICAGYKLNCK